MEYKNSISQRLERYDKIVELEKQTGLDKFYIFVAGLLVSGVILFVIGGSELVVGLVGFIYPAYQSFKAINTPSTDDDTQWLTYWVVYAFFTITEQFTDFLLSWYVEPIWRIATIRSGIEKIHCSRACMLMVLALFDQDPFLLLH